MFNNELALDNFVCSIPVCQSESDLGSILKVFQHHDCDVIAISQANNSWGIIRASDVLGVCARLWQQQGTILAGHPRQKIEPISSARAVFQEFDSLIEPAIVYYANDKLNSLLVRWQDRSSTDIALECLVIDKLGKLKGKVNRTKVLKYLASTTKKYQSSLLPASILPEPIASLINSIALPWKIETLAGQHLYSNLAWQESVTSSSQPRERDLPEMAIANWWIEQQYLAQKDKGIADRQLSETSLFHQHESTVAKSSLSNLAASAWEKNTAPALAQNCAALNILPKDRTRLNASGIGNCLEDSDPEPTQDRHLEVQIEQKQEWCWLKIPLSVQPEAESTTLNSYSCWLIIATKSSLSDLISEQKSPSVVGELLKILNHELKSPLTGIVGLSSLLKDGQLGKLNQRQTLYTQLIHNGAHKLMGIVNDLLELQGLTPKKSQANSNSVSLNLKSLCLEVYQQIVTKLNNSHVAESQPEIAQSQLRLAIEPELEIAIANKLCLSAILSHLILETLQFAEIRDDTVAIEAATSNPQQQEVYQTKITISRGMVAGSRSDLAADSACASLPKQSSGWHLILAKYLAAQISGKIDGSYTKYGCQLTLLLPVATFSKAKSPQKNCSGIALPASQRQNLTILCLYPETEVVNPEQYRQYDLDFKLKDWIEQDWSNMSNSQANYQHRIIEADGLEQAHTLARIWQLDVILLDGHQITEPEQYLRSLQQSSYLAALPLITLDTRTTESANQIEGLNVYPCLIPAQCRSIEDLAEVIQIATNS